MRVLLPTMRDPGQIGGTSTHLAMLTRGLEALGHDAHALFLGGTMPGVVRKTSLVWPAGALNRVRAGWGMMYAAEARARLLASVTARELARATRVSGEPGDDRPGGAAPWEVLNAQEVYSIPYLREVADEFGIPLVLTLHGYPLYESVSEGFTSGSRMGHHYLMRAEMRALRLADAVVTVDTRLYRHALSLVPEQASAIYTLMNFVDTSVLTPLGYSAEDEERRRALRKAWDVPEGKYVLFCPRRLVKKNGVIYPSLALSTMSDSDRERFLLLHAGEGGEQGEIERIVRENGLEKYVRLLGGQGPETVRDLYHLADIVLVPSVHSQNVEEATSLSALEAMACGRPLVAGNVGGLAEMVVDGETGLLVQADGEALAAAILRLTASPELRARLAAAARRYVVENHSHLRAAAAYVEVYRRTAAGRRSPGANTAPRERADAPAGDPLATAQPAGMLGLEWPTISVLGFPLDVVTLEQAAQWAIGAAAGAAAPAGRTAFAVSFNPELVMRAQADPAAAEVLWEADLSYPDGVGAAWAAGRQGARLSASESGQPERVAGIELAERVLELAAERGLAVFFLGAAGGVAEEAARRQVERLPGLRVAGTHHGYFAPEEEAGVADIIRASGASILLVAMGAPRQELLLYRHRHRLGVPVGLGVGGSFDVWAGTVRRAPAWSQRAKVEWLYRLARDPRRWRRQSVLPRYAVQVLRWSAEDYGPPRRRKASAAESGASGADRDETGGGG
ncbi:MAG: WecB/TagA/CpsF family glycosyltransferase [Thermoleophilia bacterium]|nr:WecB/TagA/CpsF family glycosyltransferase [Thermoleophilia bacterium]